MNESTFCEIKHMNGLFSKARYMIGVGFKYRINIRHD